MLPLPSSFTRNKLPTYRAKASVFPPTPVYCRSTYLAFSGICVSLQSLFFLLFFICRNWHESLRLYCASNGGAIAAKEEAQQAPSRPVAAPIPFFLFSAKQGLSSLSVYLFHPLQLLSGTNFFAISPCLVPPLPTLAYNINYALAHWARGSGGDTRKKVRAFSFTILILRSASWFIPRSAIVCSLHANMLTLGGSVAPRTCTHASLSHSIPLMLLSSLRSSDYVYNLLD